MEPVRVVASMMRELPASPLGRKMTLAAFSSQQRLPETSSK
jgi:hypothetical protein